MGFPEIPEDDHTRVQCSDLPMHGIIGSDDSDNEIQIDDAYAGYQPLSTNGNDNVQSMMDDDSSENESTVESDIQSQTNDTVAVRTETNLDTEIQNEIWNAPRPQELNIELDSNKTEEILSVMSKISLPLLKTPIWAQNIPEEKWKEDLLERIRHRNQNES